MGTVEKLIQIKQETGWTQGKLATLLDLDQSQVSRFLNEKTTMTRRVKQAICDLYDRVVLRKVLIYAEKGVGIAIIEKRKNGAMGLHYDRLTTKEVELVERASSHCDPVNGGNIKSCKKILEAAGFEVLCNISITAKQTKSIIVKDIVGRFDDDVLTVLEHDPLPGMINLRGTKPLSIEWLLKKIADAGLNYIKIRYFGVEMTLSRAAYKEFSKNPRLYTIQSVYDRLH